MKLIHTAKKALYISVAKYFRYWSNKSLRRWNPRVIVVTGSVGKTTMLNLIETQLGPAAHYSHNANSAFGIAFDIVGMRGITSSKLKWLYLFIAVPLRSLFFTRHEKYYVAEIDGERPREASLLAEWLRPEVTVWVSLGRSHAVFYDAVVASGRYGSVDEAIADEFASLARNTSKLVIVDGGNPAMTTQIKDISGKIVAITDAALHKYHVSPTSASFVMSSGTFSFSDPMPKETYVQLAMLEQLMNYLALPITHDVSSFSSPPGRSRHFAGIKDTHLIDSSYNAHLISMRSMIAMMQAMPATHKWAVIGDMVEQGKSESEEHRLLGELLSTTDFEQIILVGRRVSRYTHPAISSSSSQRHVESFANARDALQYIVDHLQGNEVLLFKGSQYLEWIVEKLLLNPQDVSKLARQDSASVKRRASWGLS